MKVELVDARALEQIGEWRAARHLPPWPEGWLSAHGYWVSDLAAGWLVPSVGSCRAWIEDFITNPRADRKLSSRALFAVEAHIETVALEQGFRFLLGTTQHDSIRERVKLAGYTVSDPIFSLHSKELTRV